MASSVPWNAAVIGPASSWPAELGDVGAGGEDALAAGDTTAPGGSAASSSAASRSSAQQRAGQRVDLAVGQRDDRDAVVAPVEGEQVCHRASLAPRPTVGTGPARRSDGRIGPFRFRRVGNTHGDVQALFALMSRQHGVGVDDARPAQLGVDRRAERRLLRDGAIDSPSPGVLIAGGVAGDVPPPGDGRRAGRPASLPCPTAPPPASTASTASTSDGHHRRASSARRQPAPSAAARSSHRTPRPTSPRT